MSRLIMALVLGLAFAVPTGHADQHGMKHGANKQCEHKGGHHGKTGKKRAMHHANPMPNLMMVVKRKSAELGLTDQQQQQLAQWRDENQMTLTQQLENVQRLEDEIMAASLEGEDETSLMARMDEMLAVRRSIAQRKVQCRDKLKQILTAEQYDDVISTYKAHRAAHMGKMKQHMM